MDKREEKTINKILDSFTRLLAIKDYDSITIQDILDISRVSRSTFYSHFKTKDDLLLYVSNHIFGHVFSKTLEEEKTHDFSKDIFFSYRHLVEHIFYHVRDEKEFFKGILKPNGPKIFINEFRKQLSILVDSYFNNYPYKEKLPLKLKKSIIVNDFIVILDYWVQNNFVETPEEIAGYFIESFIN